MFSVLLTEGRDYLPLRPDCRILNFSISRDTQTHCSYIEILDDDVIEPEEYFTVKLLTSNPVVIFVNGEANVNIIDNDSGFITPDGQTTPDNSITGGQATPDNSITPDQTTPITDGQTTPDDSITQTTPDNDIGHTSSLAPPTRGMFV